MVANQIDSLKRGPYPGPRLNFLERYDQVYDYGVRFYDTPIYQYLGARINDFLGIDAVKAGRIVNCCVDAIFRESWDAARHCAIATPRTGNCYPGAGVGDGAAPFLMASRRSSAMKGFISTATPCEAIEVTVCELVSPVITTAGTSRPSAARS